MRGVPYIQVPTTILAHDSAIGGKVAVNHPLAKNAIGSFYQPRGVFYNVSRLETLTSRDRVSGLGELIKHAYLSRLRPRRIVRGRFVSGAYTSARLGALARAWD